MPTAHVDLAALRHNLELLRSRLRTPCRVLAAVKANAYGHGAKGVAVALQDAGVDWFGVATPTEAFELREAGVRGRILLFGPSYRQVAELVAAEIDLTVADRASLEAIRASGAGGARVHLKVDTGMGRLGERTTEALELARRIADDRRLDLKAVWTHFASADEPQPDFTRGQIEEFDEFRQRLERESLLPPLSHACNSAGLLAHPEAHYQLVRPGIALYGYAPSEHLAHQCPDLRQVMSVSAPITFVKRVSEGTPISYGATWRAPRATTIATVRFGYADGFPRLLGNRGWASLGGVRVEVVGRVCMDQLMLDVGDLQPLPGDRVTLFGPGGPGADEVGELAETVSYEILTSVSPRVTRSYRR